MKRIWKAGLLTLLLGGCAVGPNYEAPKSDAPEAFAASSAATPANVDLARWWESFSDKELNSLIERAVAANPDIEIAISRLEEARTYEIAVVGAALPAIGGSGGAGVGTGTDLSRGTRVAPGLSQADNSRAGKITQVIGFDARWEIDLFGKYRREIEAVHADADAAAAAKNALLLAVLSDLSRSYFDLRGFDMRIGFLKRNIGLMQDAVNLLQMRFDRGLTNELDVTLAKRELATLKSQLSPLIAQREAAADTIAVLVGVYPEAMKAELAAPGVIPPLPLAVAPGKPADLLRRRPDVTEAERELAAATARVGVATADLFPHIGTTAGAGWQVIGGAATSIWAAGASFAAPILDFGTLDAIVQVADLRSREFAANYKRTVIGAVREVDKAAADYSAQQDRLNDLTDALEAGHRSVTLATQRYERGLTDYLNVLDAQRQEYALEDQYAAAQNQAADSLVALYRGLGGGWESYSAEPEIRRPLPAVIAAFAHLPEVLP